jgi:tetratricopeptide (TPR) repeat protein
VCRTHDLDAYASRILAALGRTMARIGQVKEGLALLEKAVALDVSAEPQITRSFALISLAEALLLAGNLDEALAVATEAAQRTAEHEERGAEAHARWLLATIHSARGANLEAAAKMFETATASATELGLLPLLAHCHLGYSQLQRRRGFRPAADKLLESGDCLLLKLGMKPWFQYE